MGYASAGVNQIIDVANAAVDKAADAVQEVEDGAVAAGHSAINLGDRTFDGALAEVRELKDELVEKLRNLADSVTEPLP